MDPLTKIERCLKYHDYASATYLAEYILSTDRKYTLLAGIIHYFNGEYAKVVALLNSAHTTTAVFYTALAQRAMRKHSRAISNIEKIVSGQTASDSPCSGWYSRYFVDSSDKEFFLCILGELYILRGESATGVKYMANAMKQSALLPAVERLYAENILLKNIPSCPISEYYINLFEFTAKNWKMESGQDSERSRLIREHSKLVPGVGSYLISKAASASSQFGDEKEATRLFDILRSKEPSWIGEMDAYSTMLWRRQDGNTLGLLAKELIATHPEHHITWIVIGNYYSIRKKTKEATQAFIRSISIRETPHVYTLLGFEFNSRSMFVDAQSPFRSSLSMQKNNDRALFGLGISYAETFKKDAAESYFRKAMEINPHSLQMKAYLVRFYVRNKEYEKAMGCICEYLKIPSFNKEEIANQIEMMSGSYTELEELIVCEFAELLFRKEEMELAKRVLGTVSCRTTTYYSKRSLLENGE